MSKLTYVVHFSDQKRVRGNELFQRKEYERAIHSYQKGLHMIENYLESEVYIVNIVQLTKHVDYHNDFFQQSGPEPTKEVQDMQIRCWNNIAAAQLKVSIGQKGNPLSY